jgi:hypothetical protein
MAWELAGEGKAGVVINGVYDAWTPARAYQHYHGGIRILSETASARLASPTSVDFDKLTPQIGVNPKVRSWNFPLVWPGGGWKLANIVDYMQSGAFALMRNAARYRDRWLRDFYTVGKDAVRERKPGEPFAFLIPPISYASRWQLDGFLSLKSILARGGVEITNAGSTFEVDDKQYPAGTTIILMAQPYGAFAKTLLERQHYPDLREYPGGPPRRPYDVTAHTLPLLMGVNVVRIDRPFDLPENTGFGYNGGYGYGQLAQPRVGLFKSYAPSMDEGWTRWTFDQYKDRYDALGFKLSYASMMDADIRAGNLRAKFDCIIIPAQSAQQIVNGLSKDRYPAEVSGGLGQTGVDALKKFVEEGGTIITLNEASQFAIDKLGVPVKNALEGVPAKDFYCPGSILRIKFDASSPLTKGAPTLERTADESIAWFENGPAFETTSDHARVIARFVDAKEVLLSGWLLGAEKIANKGAIVEVKRGKGRVVMFAFRPQYRGQSIATLPFLFNAIQASSVAR